jgi:FHS family Na+ dependent glucose MFS transporter 1
MTDGTLTDPATPSTGRAVPVAVYLVGFALVGVAANLAGPALSHLRGRVGTNDGGIALVFGGNALGYIAGSLWAGRGLDRGSGHRWMARAAVGVTACVIGVALAPNLASLVAVFALMGLMCGLIDVCGNTLVARSRPDGAAAALNALHLCFGVGALFTPVLVNRALAWSGSVWPTVVPVGLLTAYCVVRLSALPVPVQTRRRVAGPTSGAAHGRHVGIVALFFFSYVALETGFAGWIHSYVEQIRYGGAATATGVTASFWAGFTLGRLAAIPLSRVVSAGWLVAGAMSLSVVSAGLFWALRGPGAWLWVVTFVFAVSVAPQYASMMAFAEHHLVLSGRSTSVFVAASGLGLLVLPSLIGQMFDRWGATSLPPTILVAVAVTGIVGLIVGRMLSGQRPPATSTSAPVT